MFDTFAGGQASYNIGHSLRLRASASAYLSRTFGSPTDNNKWTLSLWLKRAGVTSTDLFMAGSAGNLSTVSLETNAGLGFYQVVGGVNKGQVVATPILRDPSAHYHVVVVFDDANGTAADRLIFYVNGERQAVTVSTAIVAGNSWINKNATVHRFGGGVFNGNPDEYLSEPIFADGQALTPSYFGETNSDGVWVPKKYAGTYGNNGSYLDFSDGTSTTTLGYDAAGSNDWTLNNISTTAGVTYDWMTDTPTNNYCTLNPLDRGSSVSLLNANLDTSLTSAGTCRAGILVSSGKWYWEATLKSTATNSAEIGVCTAAAGLAGYLGGDAYGWGYHGLGGLYNNGAYTAGVSGNYITTTYTANDVISVVLDSDAGTLTFWKNGATIGTAVNSGLIGASLSPAVGQPSGTNTHSFNFGQRPFTYTPPTGFKALCTANLPAVTIPNPRKHFDVKSRAGVVATTQTVTGIGFAPDLVWVKSRTNADSHQITDLLRGVGKTLRSDSAVTEQTNDNNGYLSAFTSDGYTLTDGGTSGIVIKANGVNYVDWLWKANGAGVTNTDGSITSTVSANTTAGFSIVTYTGTGANATVGHGLGVAPKMVIVKCRNPVTVSNWPVSHLAAGALVYLNLTNSAFGTLLSHTGTTFGLTSDGDQNASGKDFAAYCFAEIPGYSKFGSYVGNGNADGPFVFCGFRPRYVLIKDASIAMSWILLDAARNTYNPENAALYPNLSDAEASSGYYVDFTANGFKLRHGGATLNTTSSTLIFAAFAEYPFGGSNVSPSHAR